MPILELTVKFEVFCSCGEGLCAQTTVGENRSGPTITVEPCAKCLEQAKDDGEQKGYDNGFEKGQQAGKDN